MSIIEHLVLFKVKDDVAPSEIDAMVDRMNSLVSLEQVLHLTAGPLLRIQSSPSLSFTHFLHCRYNSKDDFHAYAVHPTHVAVVKANDPFCDDAMALDFVAEDLQGGLVPPPGSAMQVTFFKLKEGLGDQVKDEVLGAIRGIQQEFKQAIQLTCGENFSPGRAHGFSIASLAVFPGLSELEAADSNEEIGNYKKNEMIKEHLESVMVLDYIVPSPKARSASC
ncbi:stress-response A/B barrel domain-containing protein UP3-like [Gastrolobium bilobum]|uniref:stress-response A/B barrel domain-containing protein UP3-like n=1 Tax=Gastrolobium bilobum TaxID=150636 RepID=UPI002AAF2760|nr:stress-response A/B barrel domain-containing protein UP3-like [Gastrolobium bilobum]